MHRNELIDSELDREIHELLAVEPSREFVPALRRRLANEPVASEWSFGCTLALVGAITVVVVAGVNSRPGSSAGGQRPPSVSSVNSSLPPLFHSAAARDIAAAPVLGVRVSRSHTMIRRQQPLADRPAEPEVLVSQGEAAALRRLFTDIRAGRVELSSVDLPASDDEVSELTGIHPLVPITIQEGVLQ